MIIFPLIVINIIIFVLFLSVILLIASIILFIIFSKKSKANNKFRIPKIVTLITGALSLIPLCIVILLVGIYFYTLTVVPKNFVKCEKITYTEDGFIVNDDEYIKLEYNATPYFSDIDSTPVFSYCPKGIFNRSSWYNVFVTYNSENYPIYYKFDEYNHDYDLYVRKNDYPFFENYYETNYYWSNVTWSPYDDPDIPDTITNVLNQYASRNDSKLLTYNQSIEFYAISLDGTAYVHRYYIIKDTDQIISLATRREYDSTEGYFKYYGFDLTYEESALFLPYFN